MRGPCDPEEREATAAIVAFGVNAPAEDILARVRRTSTCTRRSPDIAF